MNLAAAQRIFSEADIYFTPHITLEPETGCDAVFRIGTLVNKDAAYSKSSKFCYEILIFMKKAKEKPYTAAVMAAAFSNCPEPPISNNLYP